jgi:hypothetical protein
LAKFGLKRVVKIFYNVGHHLFDAIAYLLKCNETSNSIQKKNVIFKYLFKY